MEFTTILRNYWKYIFRWKSFYAVEYGVVTIKMNISHGAPTNMLDCLSFIRDQNDNGPIMVYVVGSANYMLISIDFNQSNRH
jgi:hypothetical protein